MVVVSAGNNGKDAANYLPANVEGVITVGASDADKNSISISNYGDTVDCYAVASSTSAAASIVSGFLAGNGDLDKLEENDYIFDSDGVTVTAEGAGDDDERIKITRSWEGVAEDGLATDSTLSAMANALGKTEAEMLKELKTSYSKYIKWHNEDSDFNYLSFPDGLLPWFAAETSSGFISETKLEAMSFVSGTATLSNVSSDDYYGYWGGLEEEETYTVTIKDSYDNEYTISEYGSASATMANVTFDGKIKAITDLGTKITMVTCMDHTAGSYEGTYNAYAVCVDVTQNNKNADNRGSAIIMIVCFPTGEHEATYGRVIYTLYDENGAFLTAGHYGDAKEDGVTADNPNKTYVRSSGGAWYPGKWNGNNVYVLNSPEYVLYDDVKIQGVGPSTASGSYINLDPDYYQRFAGQLVLTWEPNEPQYEPIGILLTKLDKETSKDGRHVD